jgi:hypothetical protein
MFRREIDKCWSQGLGSARVIARDLCCEGFSQSIGEIDHERRGMTEGVSPIRLLVVSPQTT